MEKAFKYLSFALFAIALPYLTIWCLSMLIDLSQMAEDWDEYVAFVIIVIATLSLIVGGAICLKTIYKSIKK